MGQRHATSIYNLCDVIYEHVCHQVQSCMKSRCNTFCYASKLYICSAQSENLGNSGITLRKVRIPRFADRVRILTLRGTIPELSVRKVELSVRKVRIGTK